MSTATTTAKPENVCSSTLSSKGQITVPIEIRRRLGLKEGDKVGFVFESDRTVLRPIRAEVNPFEEFIGIVPELGTLAEIDACIREMRGGGEDFPD